MTMRVLLTLLFVALPALAAPPDASRSMAALAALKAALASKPKSIAALASKDFASTALTKSDARVARKLLWEAYASMIRSDRAREIKDRLLKEDQLEMPFDFKSFGEKPQEGRSLWISLHGGGNAPKQVN